MHSNDHLYKFGVSCNPSKRVKQLQTGNPNLIRLLWQVEVEQAFEVEHVLHQYLKEYQKWVRGEWFWLSSGQVLKIAQTVLEHTD
tara:strand:- start:999 stop:1253 length:255 start_codon:yes stop_codon:yes gene_type:complete